MIAVTHPFRLGSIGTVLDPKNRYALYGSGEVIGVVGNTVVLHFGYEADTDNPIVMEFQSIEIGLVNSEK